MTDLARVLVVGTGSIGLRHLGVLRSIAGVTPVAVPVRPGRAAELRARGFEARDDLSSALDLAPRGALIATDTGRHAADALACLARGVPVLVEKPLASNASDARRVVEAARDSGLDVRVACCLRFDAALAWMREQLDSIGKIVSADLECSSWLPDWRCDRDHLSGYAARPGEGGVLLDLVHELDAACWFLGPVRRVVARLSNAGLVELPASIEESATLMTEHADGLVATVRLSYAARPSVRKHRYLGEHGLLEWDGIARVARHLGASGLEVARHDSKDRDAMYHDQDKAWLESLAGEPRPRLVSGESGALSVALCDAARRSNASGEWVSLA